MELPRGDTIDALRTAQAHADSLALVTADRALLSSRHTTFDARCWGPCPSTPADERRV